MQSLEISKARIEGARTLRSIIRTMKILAAVGVRQDEKARDSFAEYFRTIELGLQVALRNLGIGATSRAGDDGKFDAATLAIVIGSDMGMCGQFNERIAAFAKGHLGALSRKKVKLIAVGERTALRLEELELFPDCILACPANPATGIASTIRQLLSRLDEWRGESPGGRVLAFHNRQAGRGKECDSRLTRVLPVDEDYLLALKDRPWNSRSLPWFRMDREELLHACLRGVVYGSLYRIFLDSLESENSARLEAMEAAERHIDERLAELRASFNEERQEAITSELLDIIAGVETASE